MSASERALAALLARDEIRTLPIRYASAVEARDAAAMGDLFAPTARFGAYGDGPEGLRNAMAESMNGSLFAVILVANHQIDLQDETSATGRVWAHCYAQTRADGFIDQLIRYEDRYQRVDGRWLFAHRRHRLWYGTRHERSPFAQDAANWPRSQIGVGDIPLADPVFSDWWRSRADG
ncbi:nuclear transport factor 2 family protein [Mycobacterium sp.]|uniref:nuclear transport factor 2 family protein n=1 Tax=Mycobacterium sp. TaxID=1785 RepID=UPI0025EA9D3E|nr:nuclear transport factor 2 family protein [Mycobacterium sp.]